MKKNLSFIIWILVFIVLIGSASTFIHLTNLYKDHEQFESDSELLNLQVEELNFETTTAFIKIYEKYVFEGEDNIFGESIINSYRLLLSYDEELGLFKTMFTLLPGENITYINYDFSLIIVYDMPINTTAEEYQNIVNAINVFMRSCSTDSGYYYYLPNDVSIYNDVVTFYVSQSLEDITKYIELKSR